MKDVRVLLRVLPAVVVTVVLGILGMHALSSPPMSMSMSGSTSGSTSTSMATSTSMSMAGPTHHGDTAAPLDAAAAGGSSDDMGQMMMLCVAMLASGGALLLALFSWRRTPRRWAVLRLASPGTGSWWRAPPLGAGPPAAWKFSVIRC